MWIGARRGETSVRVVMSREVYDDAIFFRTESTEWFLMMRIPSSPKMISWG